MSGSKVVKKPDKASLYKFAKEAAVFEKGYYNIKVRQKKGH